jgi:hypothetical protein
MTSLLEAELLSPALVLPPSAEFGGPLLRAALAPGPAPRAAVVLATLRASVASAASLGAPATLLGVNALGPGVAVTRAQTPAGATVLQETAVPGVWEEVAANLPRYSAVTRRTLVQPAGSNAIRNPRAEGFVAGTPGTAPTHWSVTTTASGITRQINAGGVESGLPYLEVRYHGTNSSGGVLQIGVSGEANTAVAAAPGDVLTASAFVKLAAGSLSGLTSVTVLMRARNAGGSQIGITSTTITPTGAALGSQRAQATLTMPALTAFAQAQVLLTVPIAGTIDITLRIAAMQHETGSAAGAPVLPVALTPAATVRGIDAPIWTPSPMPARGIILLRGSMPALASASPLGLAQLDDGADANRIVARIGAGGGQPECLVVTSGLTVATLMPAGAFTAGSEWRALLAWSPGGVRFGTTAGGVVSASVARPPGVLRALLGQANAAGTLPLGGEVTADLYGYWPSEAEALALLTA